MACFHIEANKFSVAFKNITHTGRLNQIQPCKEVETKLYKRLHTQQVCQHFWDTTIRLDLRYYGKNKVFLLKKFFSNPTAHLAHERSMLGYPLNKAEKSKSPKLNFSLK